MYFRMHAGFVHLHDLFSTYYLGLLECGLQKGRLVAGIDGAE